MKDIGVKNHWRIKIQAQEKHRRIALRIDRRVDSHTHLFEQTRSVSNGF